MIEIQQYSPQLAGEWKAFVDASNNGTLFHDLDFLSYHPAEKFEVHHLLFRETGNLIGLMPAAAITEPDGKRFLKSPFGASAGGIVLPYRQSVNTAMEIVSALKEFAQTNKFDGIEMRLGPSVYQREPNEHLGFALAANEFLMVRRWLTSVILLPAYPDDVMGLLSSRLARYARAVERKGVLCTEAGPELLPDFHEMLCQDRAKHDAVPTHNLNELQSLFNRLPGRIRLFECAVDSKPAAWALIFSLNERVAYVMYLCHDNAFDEQRPALALAVHLARQCVSLGFRFLDYGPTSFDDMSLNKGLAFFKEGLGSIGFCRDAWRWHRG